MTVPLDALTTPVSLTVLTAARGNNASKRLIADWSGRPIRDPTHSLGISAGHVEHVQVPGLAGLRDLLARIQHNQALVHGVPTGSQPGDVLMLLLANHFTGVPGTVARTLECFAYPPGARLLMLDYDPDPAAPDRIASAADLIARLQAFSPAMQDTGWLATTSTSSAIRDKETGAWLRPPEGMHVYLVVTGDVARWRSSLQVRLWLAGHGYCKVATPNAQTGVAAVLERAIIDMLVFSAERLDYVSGAIIPSGASFYQDRPPPELHPGTVLNLASLPEVSDQERAEYARRVAQAKASLIPERRAMVRLHIQAATPDLPAEGVDQEIGARMARAERGDLDVGHTLYFDNRVTLTAGELAQARRLDGKRLADPQEPTYGQGHAVFHWRGGDWRVVSWAHGVRKVYQLARAPWYQQESTSVPALATIAAEEVPSWLA